MMSEQKLREWRKELSELWFSMEMVETVKPEEKSYYKIEGILECMDTILNRYSDSEQERKVK